MKNRKQIYPNVLFRVNNYPFLVSGEYVSDIQNVPDTVITLSKSQPLEKMCLSFGRIVYLIDINEILGIRAADRDDKCGVSCKKKIIIFNGEPLKGILADEVFSVEKTESFYRIEKKCAMPDTIKNYYVFQKTNEVVMELDLNFLRAKT